MKKYYVGIALLCFVSFSGCIESNRDGSESMGIIKFNQDQLFVELHEETAKKQEEEILLDERFHLDKRTVPMATRFPYGTYEGQYDQHQEILENSGEAESGSYYVYKISMGTVSGDFGNTTYWVPQIKGLEDQEKQERINKLLSEESQEWLYQNWGGYPTKLYVEYQSERYLSYCYQMQGIVYQAYAPEEEMEIYITIDLEEEKRVKLEDLIDWKDEVFLYGFNKLCLGREEEVTERIIDILKMANQTLTEYREEVIRKYGEDCADERRFLGSMYQKTYFYLRPGRIVVELRNSCGWDDVTIEILVFEGFLKVEPWF